MTLNRRVKDQKCVLKFGGHLLELQNGKLFGHRRSEIVWRGGVWF